MTTPATTAPRSPAASGAITQRQFEFRGGALKLQSCDEPEVILSGPADTGKTIAALSRLHRLCCENKGVQAVIVRKTYKSTVGSVVQSFIKKILLPDSGVVVYGGERPEWFDYPNGSRIWVGGMDNPDKVLSSERDLIYVNQAEELTLTDWGYLTTRANGRAGNLPFGQVFGDCNPGGATHWIKSRDGLKLLESRHEDNPDIFDASGAILEKGRKRIAALDKLPGVLKDRLRFGRWVSAEGAVYAFDANIHLIDSFDIPRDWPRLRVVDFGYTNPFVCQWWAIDGDGRLYLYREIYMSQRTVKQHAMDIHRETLGIEREIWEGLDYDRRLKLVYAVAAKDTETIKHTLGISKEKAIEFIGNTESIDATITDHDAEDRATMSENGIYTIAANKDVSPGIQAVQERLAVAGDDRPRLFVFRDCLVERDETLAEAHRPICTRDEFDVYLWPKAQDGKPIKDAPIKLNDHGMDATRYLVYHLDSGIPSGASLVSFG